MFMKRQNNEDTLNFTFEFFYESKIKIFTVI